MANRMRPWQKDVLVFIGFTLLDGALMAVGYASAAQFGFMNPLPVWLECWWWVCGAPIWFVRTTGIGVAWGWPILWANPFIYGLMWWGAWRLLMLLRTNPSA
jgi:hypothetical protein